MIDTVYTMALAGLLHDVGKFAERAGMEITQQYQNDNEHLYQPHYEGRSSHKHALYSAAFIERFTNLLPSLEEQATARSGNSLINLVPSNI